MALLNHYHKFITSPHVSSLTEKSSLHLITSLVTIEGPSAITKHFQGDQLKFKDHKFLDFVEGPSSLAVIIETTLEFITGGGFYLPGLDDNFIADQNVTLPVVGIISKYSPVKANYPRSISYRSMTMARYQISESAGIKAVYSNLLM